MKLEVTKRELFSITINETGIEIILTMNVKHGRVAKTETTLTIMQDIEFAEVDDVKADRLSIAAAILKGVNEANGKANAALAGIAELDAL